MNPFVELANLGRLSYGIVVYHNAVDCNRTRRQAP